MRFTSSNSRHTRAIRESLCESFSVENSASSCLNGIVAGPNSARFLAISIPLWPTHRAIRPYDLINYFHYPRKVNAFLETSNLVRVCEAELMTDGKPSYNKGWLREIVRCVSFGIELTLSRSRYLSFIDLSVIRFVKIWDIFDSRCKHKRWYVKI